MTQMILCGVIAVGAVLTGVVGAVLITLLYGPSGWEGWKKFAATHELIFRPGNFLLGGTCIVGVYRGHNLMIETFTQNKATCTRVRLKAGNLSPERCHEIAKDLSASSTSEEVFGLLTGRDLLDISGGKIEAAAGGMVLTYQQSGIMAEMGELQSACDLLGDILDGYPVMVAIGGAAIQSLETISRLNTQFSGVAIQMMKDIVQATQRQLGSRAERLLCPACLVHPGPHRADLPWQFDETYYGCRVCRQSQEFIECPKGVVAVLDANWNDVQAGQDGLLQVNWLAFRALFDFDQVEIVQAMDEDVERFAVQVGNDTDPLRRPRYAQMRCVVNPRCGLSDNTLRVLESTFGRVEMSA